MGRSHGVVLAWCLVSGLASCAEERGYQESCAAADECGEGLECRPVLFGSTSGCHGGTDLQCIKVCTTNEECAGVSPNGVCTPDCSGARFCT